MAEEREIGPAEMPQFGPPSVPRPAASVVLLRRAGGGDGDRTPQGLEVLLLKRSAEARFMPGVWVFPGGSVDPADGEGEAGARACALRELREEAGITLPPGSDLVLFSRWITPAVVATRFDARFFLALAPDDAPPEPDGSETVEARWFEPRAALEANDRKEILLAFPTVTQLGLLAEQPSADAALDAYRDGVVEPVLPVVVGSREDARVLLPGDPDYPSD